MTTTLHSSCTTAPPARSSSRHGTKTASGARDGDKPVTTQYDIKTGNVTRELWGANNEIGRADGKPSIVEHDPKTGNVIYKEWRTGDKLERADGKPPVVGHDAKTGNITYEAWCNDDYQWPADTPYPSGMVTEPISGARIGRLDRVDGPPHPP